MSPFPHSLNFIFTPKTQRLNAMQIAEHFVPLEFVLCVKENSEEERVKSRVSCNSK